MKMLLSFIVVSLSIPILLISYLIADINISTEAAVAIGGMFLTLCSAVAWGARGWIASLVADRDSWKNMALENIDDMELMANQIRKSKGKPPIRTLAAVIPESSSPPTEQQKETASIATVRARQAMLRIDLGLPEKEVTNVNINTNLVAEITAKMKDKVDAGAEEIKQEVDKSVEEIKGKIDEI